MKKVLVIFGTRPEAIKLAPVIQKLKVKNHKFLIKVCVTGQHREMLDQVLNSFKIQPDYDLNIMKKNQNLFDLTMNELRKLKNILEREHPDIVLVQGDTTTAFTASLTAFYFKTKIAHVEAGLRTENKFNPFPEEVNRKLTDHLADLCFAPTEKARENLVKEGIEDRKIFITGNTVIDALLMTVEKQKDQKVQKKFEQNFQKKYGIQFDKKRIVTVTSHRRESFGRDLENICHALKKIAENNTDILIIYPLHLNPNIQKPVRKILNNVYNIHLVEPLDYFSFVWLMTRAHLILTDSGGIQEEAPSLGKPVLVMRKVTERPEGIEAGTAKLVGTEYESIYSETMELLKNKKLYQSMAKAVNPYGDGKASMRIKRILNREL